MNIAYFSHYFTPEVGAPSARIYDMAQCWLAQGDQVEVVTCFPNHPSGQIYPGYHLARYQPEWLHGISVHRNWTYVTANQGFLKRTLGHVSLWPSARFHSERHLIGPDVAIGTSPTFFAAMAAAGAARRRQIPFIMEVRDLWPAVFVDLGVIRNRYLIWLLGQWEMSLYRQANQIVTVTEAFRQNLIDRGISAKKVHTIRNGADLDFWQPKSAPDKLRAELGLIDKFIVLYIGTHGISQALQQVLNAAKELAVEKQIHFLFVGNGAQKAALQQQAKEQHLQNVTFHDSVTKEVVADYYALSDVCLIPLRNIPLFDTFIPSKIFEVMAVERPIIGSVRGEAAEILRKSHSAIVVEPEDYAALAAAIRTLYQQPERRKQMGGDGRRFVAAHYSRCALASEYKAVIQSAIERFGSS